MESDKERARAAHLKRARAKFRRRLAELQRRRRLVPPQPPPRYDDVYWRGVEWLDSLCR